MAKTRPRKLAMLKTENWKLVITLDPRQRWEVTVSNNKYNVTRDNVTLNFSEKEFRKYFYEVE